MLTLWPFFSNTLLYFCESKFLYIVNIFNLTFSTGHSGLSFEERNSRGRLVVQPALAEVDLTPAVQISEHSKGQNMLLKICVDIVDLLSFFFFITFLTSLTSSSTFGGRGEIRTLKSGPSSICKWRLCRECLMMSPSPVWCPAPVQLSWWSSLSTLVHKENFLSPPQVRISLSPEH